MDSGEQLQRGEREPERIVWVGMFNQQLGLCTYVSFLVHIRHVAFHDLARVLLFRVEEISHGLDTHRCGRQRDQGLNKPYCSNKIIRRFPSSTFCALSESAVLR